MNNSYPGAQPRQGPWPPAKRPPDYVFILLLLAAIAFFLLVLALLFLWAVPGLLGLLPEQNLPLVGNLTADTVLYAAGGLFLFAILSFLLARLRIRRNSTFQFFNGCPSCKQHDLIRVHRSHTQRILATALVMPLRNYACRNCSWNGVLLFYVPPGVAQQALVLPGEAAEADESLAETIVDPRDIVDAGDTEPSPVFYPGPERPAGGEPIGASQLEQSREAPPLELAEEPAQISDEGTADELEKETGFFFAEETYEQDGAPETTAELEHEPYAQAVERTPEVVEFEGEDERGPEKTTRTANELDEIFPEATDEATGSEESVTVSTPETGRISHSFAADPPWASELSDTRGGVPSRAVVIAPFGLSMRSAPDKQADIVMSLEADTIVEVLDRHETDAPVSWHRVRHEGQVGWVSAAFLRYLHS